MCNRCHRLFNKKLTRGETIMKRCIAAHRAMAYPPKVTREIQTRARERHASQKYYLSSASQSFTACIHPSRRFLQIYAAFQYPHIGSDLKQIWQCQETLCSVTLQLPLLSIMEVMRLFKEPLQMVRTLSISWFKMDPGQLSAVLSQLRQVCPNLQAVYISCSSLLGYSAPETIPFRVVVLKETLSDLF